MRLILLAALMVSLLSTPGWADEQNGPQEIRARHIIDFEDRDEEAYDFLARFSKVGLKGFTYKLFNLEARDPRMPGQSLEFRANRKKKGLTFTFRF